MNPRLIVIAGPLEGKIYPLSEENSIGRDRSNKIWLNDSSVSRRHCLIRAEAAQFKLVDLGSQNGTQVNSIPIREHVIKHGDQIAIGDSLLVFLLHEEAEETASLDSVRLSEEDLTKLDTVLLRREDALYLDAEKVLATLPPTLRLAHDLNTLLKVSTIVNSVRDLQTFQNELLEIVFEALPAERAAILIKGDNTEEFSSILGWHRFTKREGPIQASRTVINQVLEQGVAVLSNDVHNAEAFSSSESLDVSETRSLLCVPLAAFDSLLGVIYADTRDPAVRFDEGHLQLMTAIASIAAIALDKLKHIQRLEDENQRLRTDTKLKHNMIGESARMKEVYKFIAKVAATDSTILITGESGTGKELIARAIYLNSRRAHGPLVAINCATLTESLLESELFGHEKGAFTGAIAQKKGKLEIAHGGTLFLDEVGELALNLQAKLLRVLQEGEFERLGGTRLIKIDVRLVAATNRNLEDAVRNGAFRQDLYYRLNVVSLKMPALRERRDDIPLLASYFAAKYSEKCKRRIKGISGEAKALLLGYDWPGNVRELENAIEHAIVLGSTELILPEDLPEALLETDVSLDIPIQRYYESIKEAKKQFILKALEQSGGNYPEAAKLLGIHPNNLHRLIRNLNLKPLIKN